MPGNFCHNSLRSLVLTLLMAGLLSGCFPARKTYVSVPLVHGDVIHATDGRIVRGAIIRPLSDEGTPYAEYPEVVSDEQGQFSYPLQTERRWVLVLPGSGSYRNSRNFWAQTEGEPGAYGLVSFVHPFQEQAGPATLIVFDDWRTVPADAPYAHCEMPTLAQYAYTLSRELGQLAEESWFQALMTGSHTRLTDLESLIRYELRAVARTCELPYEDYPALYGDGFEVINRLLDQVRRH
jgi:hypothetical protein